MTQMSINPQGLILERLLARSGRPVERAALKHACYEALAAWPGQPAENWWKWLVEAGNSLQLRLQVLDLPAHDAVKLVQDGAAVAGCRDDGELLLLEPISARRVRWVSSDPQGREHSERLTPRQAAQRLEGDPVRRFVVCEPALTAGSEHGLSPYNRLLAIIRPELSDIWIVVLFAFLVGLLMLATPIAVESLVNTVAFGRYLQPVLVLALLLFGFLAFGAALRGLQTWVVEIIQRRLFVRIAGELAQRLPRVTASTYDHQHPPELVNRFLDVVTVQKVTASLLLDAVSIVLGTLLGMVVLAFYHPWLLGFDLVLVLLMLFTLFLLGRGAVQTSIKESKYKYKITAWLEEVARCPLAFRQEGGYEFARERADMLVVDYLSARRKHFNILMRQIMFSLFLQALASTALLGLGGWLVIQGQLTLGQLVAAELIVGIVVGSFAKMGKHLEGYYDLLAAVDKIGSLLDLPTEKTAGILHIEHGGPARLECHSLTCDSPTGATVLSGLNLMVEPGTKAALESGGEESLSALADVLYDLRAPRAGLAEIDGIVPGDIRPDILRQHVALVRHLELITGTIAENVHLDRPDITAADVRKALAEVGLLEEINQLEHGLETPLTRRGGPLSRSQLHRLMIARSLVAKPRLFLIDGLLDVLPDDQLEPVMNSLTRPDAPWTLLVCSAQERVRRLCPVRIDLTDPSAALAPSHH